jgi:hypothetical protein
MAGRLSALAVALCVPASIAHSGIAGGSIFRCIALIFEFAQLFVGEQLVKIGSYSNPNPEASSHSGEPFSYLMK